MHSGLSMGGLESASIDGLMRIIDLNRWDLQLKTRFPTNQKTKRED
jgi:hypothetical protein